MELAFDTETYIQDEKTKEYYPILDGTGKFFVAGSIIDDKGNKKVFYNKKEMWNWIINKGLKARKNGKCVYAWAHNIKYDFYNLFQPDKNLVILCEKPFIAIYYVNQKKIIKKEKWEKYKNYLDLSHKRYCYREKGEDVIVNIKLEAVRFLDSMNLFRMSLKKVGDLIGLEKLDLPMKLKNLDKLKELESYVIRDSEIVLEGIKVLKEKIRSDGVRLKRLITINQIAISYLLKKLKEQDCNLFLGKGERILQSRFREKIKKAYRGGRVEAWGIGEYKGVSYIDCNSLYPYSATKIKFPNLKSEVYFDNPKKSYWNKIINKIGVSKVMLYNKKNEIGLIPVRLPTMSYFPKKGTYMIGVWTNGEIKKALKEGYELINMEYSITYDEEENPFKNIMPELFKKRLDDKEKKFDYHYYKSMMNNGIGKFGQWRVGQEIVFDDIEKAQEYLGENYKIIGGINDKSTIMKYKREPVKKNYKNYYCPLLVGLITAEARMIMYDAFKEIGIKKMIYTDTDSCIFKGKVKDLKNKIKVGEKMGEFKIIAESFEFKSWGRKSTKIGEEMKLSGIFKVDAQNYDKEKEVVRFRKMQGLGKGNIGEFVEEVRDLKKQAEEYIKQEKDLQETKIFIDNDILEGIRQEKDNIKYFADDILKANINLKREGSI